MDTSDPLLGLSGTLTDSKGKVWGSAARLSSRHAVTSANLEQAILSLPLTLRFPALSAQPVAELRIVATDEEVHFTLLEFSPQFEDAPTPVPAEALPDPQSAWTCLYYPGGRPDRLTGRVSAVVSQLRAVMLETEAPIRDRGALNGAPVVIDGRLAAIITNISSNSGVMAVPIAEMAKSTVTPAIGYLLAVAGQQEMARTVDEMAGHQDAASLFTRLSPSARHALEYAVGMAKQVQDESRAGADHRTVQLASRLRQERPELVIPTLHMEYLILGLFDKPGGPTRELFSRASLDEQALRALIVKATETVPPDSVIPMTLSAMPRLSKHVQEAVDKAAAAAEGRPAIRSRHLLYGALSVQGCDVIDALRFFNPLLAPESVVLDPSPGEEPQAQATPASAPQPPDEVASESDSIEISSISDAPTLADALGFKPYVEAVSRFLLSPDTKPPLTLSVEGPWGSGKSSFMLQLRDSVVGGTLLTRVAGAWKGDAAGSGSGARFGARLARAWRALPQRRRFSVQFSPWRHDKEESLWAAFALEFLRQVAEQRWFPRRWWGHLRLFLGHYRWKRGWFEACRALVSWAFLLVFVLGVPIYVFLYRPHWSERLLQVLAEKAHPQGQAAGGATAPVPPASAALVKPIEDKDEPLDPFLKTLLVIGGNAGYLAVALTIWLRAKRVIGNPLKIDLQKYMRSPDFEGRVAFVEQFHEDFKGIVDAYAGKQKVFVFIDDLDRCEVPKSADLIKAVNLLISDDPRLVFILAMDRDKVAAGLAVKYEKMLPYLSQVPASDAQLPAWKRDAGLEFGHAFLEKFIQLPFRVPDPNLDTYLEFIQTISRPSRLDGRPPFATAGSPSLVPMTSLGTVPASAPARSTMPSSNSFTVSRSSAPASAPPLASASTPKGTDTMTPSAPPPEVAAAQVEARRARELQFQGDSDKVRAVAMMYARTLGTNPRRMKQFINLFRLQAYIVNEVGLFDEGYGGAPPVTMEQLGKFVAIGLKWPTMLLDLADHPQLLVEIQELADGKKYDAFDTAPTVAKRWVSEKRVKTFFSYCIEEDSDAYSLSNAGLRQLLHVCRPRVRPRRVEAAAGGGDGGPRVTGKRGES